MTFYNVAWTILIGAGVLWVAYTYFNNKEDEEW